MLSIEQLTIVAYFDGECSIVCRKCGEAEGLPTKDALCAYSAGEYAGNEGLYCEACGAEIDAPYEWDCPYCDTTFSGDEAADKEGDYYKSRSTFKCSDECPGDSE